LIGKNEIAFQHLIYEKIDATGLLGSGVDAKRSLALLTSPEKGILL
jgi:hypothetical protein